jgi:hypothetical protein
MWLQDNPPGYIAGWANDKLIRPECRVIVCVVDQNVYREIRIKGLKLSYRILT